MEGLSTGDFEPVFRELVGETATLLCVVGAREDGVKELLGMELGYRESTESWSGVLRSLRDRGMDAPLLALGDGALGLWATLDGVSPTIAHQRCRNHRTLNVQAKLPKAMHAEARRRLREMSAAPTRAECERLWDEYVVDLSAECRNDAPETVVRDWESFVSFYDFPLEHWVHLRTTNPLESMFSAVRLRTDVTRRMKRRDIALYLVFKVALRLSERWRSLNGRRNLMGLLVDGARFEDGILTELPVTSAEAVAA